MLSETQTLSSSVDGAVPDMSTVTEYAEQMFHVIALYFPGLDQSGL